MHEAIQNAIAFKAENPTESISTCARIFHANENSVRKALHRQRTRVATSSTVKDNGGQNKILSEAQIEAIYKYVEDMYLSGLEVTKNMVLGAIILLRSTEQPPKKAPSKRWFQIFLKTHPDLLRTTTKTKPAGVVPTSAQDI